MRTSIALLIAATLTVSSCGGWQDSRANPRNWFGSAEEVELNSGAAAVNPLIPQEDSEGIFARSEAPDNTVLIAAVTSLRVDRTPTGAIIYAEGLAARQGAYNVQLRPDPEAPEGTLAFEFRAGYPGRATPQGSEATRTLRAAYSLSHGDLDGIRLVRVTALQNAQETRRR